MIRQLETRLDTVVLRLGFALTNRQARQLVSHGHVLLDGKRLNVPSARVKPGQTDRDLGQGEELRLGAGGHGDHARPALVPLPQQVGGPGTLSRLPERDEIPLPVEVEERLIVEFYSAASVLPTSSTPPGRFGTFPRARRSRAANARPGPDGQLGRVRASLRGRPTGCEATPSEANWSSAGASGSTCRAGCAGRLRLRAGCAGAVVAASGSTSAKRLETARMLQRDSTCLPSSCMPTPTTLRSRTGVSTLAISEYGGGDLV